MTVRSPKYIQHSAHIGRGREGLFNLVKSIPATLKYEPGLIVANGDFVIMHGGASVASVSQPWNQHALQPSSVWIRILGRICFGALSLSVPGQLTTRYKIGSGALADRLGLSSVKPSMRKIITECFKVILTAWNGESIWQHRMLGKESTY